MTETRQILLLMDERFVDEIDQAYPALGYSDRASFIRDAVLKELARRGIVLPESYRAGTPRTGKAKGGRTRKSANKREEEPPGMRQLRVADDEAEYRTTRPKDHED